MVKFPLVIDSLPAFMSLLLVLMVGLASAYRRSDLTINSCSAADVTFSDLDIPLRINAHCTEEVTAVAIKGDKLYQLNGLYETYGLYGGIFRYQHVFHNGTKVILRRHKMESENFQFVWELSYLNRMLYVSFSNEDTNLPNPKPWFRFIDNVLQPTDVQTYKVYFPKEKPRQLKTSLSALEASNLTALGMEAFAARFAGQASLTYVLAESLEANLDGLDLNSVLHPAIGSHLGEMLHTTYMSTSPFPAIVIDNMFNDTVLRGAIAAVTSAEANEWNGPETGIGCCREKYRLPFSSRAFRRDQWCAMLAVVVANPKFILFIEALTGISNLIPLVDRQNIQSGSSIIGIRSGGFLYVHNDFDRFGQYYRRVNALLYMNEGWKSEWRGDIELWSTNATQCRHNVPPLFNRLVIFTCTDDSFHGHPEPLQAPEGQMRIGLQLVLFTKTPIPDNQRYATNFEKLPKRQPIQKEESMQLDGNVKKIPFNFSENDPDWYHRKVYQSPHTAVFQVPCNEQVRQFCDFLKVDLPDPRSCECNFDSVY